MMGKNLLKYISGKDGYDELRSVESLYQLIL